jgi:hypothetical protein
MLARSSCIYPLWFFSSSRSSATRYCTFSATRLASSFVIVYSSGSLCSFSILRIPLDCEIGRLGGPGSWGGDVEGIPCVPVALAPLYFCCEATSFYPAYASFFLVPPFFCCVGFYVGFVFLDAALSPARDFLM